MASRPLDSTLPQARSFASPAAALPGLAAGTAILYLSLVVLIPLAALLWAAVGGGWSEFWERRHGRRTPMAALKLTVVVSLIVVVLNAFFGTLLAWVLVRDDFVGKNAVNTPGRPAVRAADHRRRRHPAAALRRRLADRRRRVLQPGRHRARADVRDAAVRGAQRAAGAVRARPRHGAGGRLARRGTASRPFAVSSSPTCCRRSCPAAGSPSPRRSASSAPSSSSQATSRSRPRSPRC